MRARPTRRSARDFLIGVADVAASRQYALVPPRVRPTLRQDVIRFAIMIGVLGAINNRDAIGVMVGVVLGGVTGFVAHKLAYRR